MRDKLSNPKFLAQLALLVTVRLIAQKDFRKRRCAIVQSTCHFSLSSRYRGDANMGPSLEPYLGGVFGIAAL